MTNDSTREKSFPLRREDPIFVQLKARTPLLFAHRGGAGEAPESTREAFLHATKTARAEILELDVQLTKKDRRGIEEFVVWHGPDLDNVLIDLPGVPTLPRARRKLQRYEIGHFTWEELRDRAWVVHPDYGQEDLAAVERLPDRRLLRLEDLLLDRDFLETPMNIEMKECFEIRHLDRFIEVLEKGRQASPKRDMVVAGNRNGALLQEFRKRTANRYATNLPAGELLKLYARSLVGWSSGIDLRQRAVQLPYPAWMTPRSLIETVRRTGGGVYVFLSRFTTLIPAIDADPKKPDEKTLFAILDRGVDGIMTDRPEHVRTLMDRWKALHP